MCLLLLTLNYSNPLTWKYVWCSSKPTGVLFSEGCICHFFGSVRVPQAATAGSFQIYNLTLGEQQQYLPAHFRTTQKVALPCWYVKTVASLNKKTSTLTKYTSTVIVLADAKCLRFYLQYFRQSHQNTTTWPTVWSLKTNISITQSDWPFI